MIKKIKFIPIGNFVFHKGMKIYKREACLRIPLGNQTVNGKLISDLSGLSASSLATSF